MWGMGPVEDTASNSSSTVAWVSVVAGTFTEPFPNNGCLFFIFNICCLAANVVSLFVSLSLPRNEFTRHHIYPPSSPNLPSCTFYSIFQTKIFNAPLMPRIRATSTTHLRFIDFMHLAIFSYITACSRCPGNNASLQSCSLAMAVILPPV
jgi:hypothetical protein